MGRMLDALKRAGPQGAAPHLAPAAETSVHLADDPPTAGTAAEEEIPFIEVGPCKSVEASASVLAAAPRAKSQTHAAPLVPLVPEASVSFRTPPSAPGRPAVALDVSAFHDPDHPLSAQYREVFKALLAALPADRPQALLFTAARPGSGTTTALLNLAVTAARLGRRRVAVVDGNPTCPALAQRLGLAEKPGLREVLAGLASLDEALRETAQPNLTALAAGVTATTGGVRYMAETVRSLLRQLRERFDLVFVDGPAWEGRAEEMTLASACDAVYLVVPESEANSPAVDELYRAIPARGGVLAGCIVAGR